MNKRFSDLRRELDEAITYADFEVAYEVAERGLDLAHRAEDIGEIKYFAAQFAIIEEDYLKAIEMLDDAIKYNPHDGAAYNDRALCMVDLGMFEEAIKYFNLGIIAEPDFATIYHNKGWLLNKLGQYDDALKCFETALELEPKRAVTYENMGDVYLNLNQKSQAICSFQKALKVLDPVYEDIKEELELRLADIMRSI
ncbi:MAG: tetratricopeptide repeat protein [Candidatus Omnitrophica bacterium]|nr:tetratricopeptide repeat protein [Candidatus Omnitrophota bacterium]